MSRLSEIPKPPKADQKSVGPHQFRRLGASILAADDAGRFAFLSATEYGEYLAGIRRGLPLRDKLGAAGLLRDAYDFDEAAQFYAEKSLLSWPGPQVHVVRLRKKGRMKPETAKAVVDFAFTTPGLGVGFELVCDSPDDDWGLVWFIVQYARRRGEWHKRSVKLTLRVRAPLSPAQAEFLNGHNVELRAVLAPMDPLIPGSRRVVLEDIVPPEQAAAVIDRLAEAGVESVLIRGDGPSFLKFYAAALDRMLQVQGRLDIREELAMGLLSGRRWLLPGFDVLSELCYAPDGGIYASELASMLAGESGEVLRLGELASTRYSDLARSPAVRAVLAASLAENQPMCSQCAYRAFCAVPPSVNLLAQGTVWGRHPSSERCALHMAILDILFARLARTETAEALRSWLG